MEKKSSIPSFFRQLLNEARFTNRTGIVLERKTKQKQASNMAVWTSASTVWFLVFSAAVTSVVNIIVGLLNICRHKGQRRLAVAVTATIKTISLNDRTSFCDRKAATTSGYSSVVSLPF